MGANLIAFVCTAPDHQPSAAMPDKLTIFHGAWAFCPRDAHADGHKWQDTGGAELDVLMRRVGLSISA